MASRVNVKFVVILCVSLVTLSLGVAGVFLWVKVRSGDRLYARGQEALQRADYKAADLYLSKAVNKQRTNVEWLKAWREAREQKIPESQTVFEDEYSVYVFGILRQLAIVQSTNVDAHREYLDAIYQQRVNLGSNREAWLHLANEAENSLKYFANEQPPALRRYRGLALAAMVMAGMDLPEDRIPLAKQDLQAAIAAAPQDVRAALELISLHATLSVRARQDDPERAAEEMKSATDLLARTAAANPENPSVLLAQLTFDASAASDRFGGMNSAEARRARLAAMQEFKPRLRELAEKFQGPAIKQIDSNTVYRFLSLAVAIDPEDGLSLASTLAQRSLEADPDNADLLMLMAQISTFSGDFERVIEIYERVEQLPPLPVGLDGLKLFAYRRTSQVGRADAAISMVAMAKDAATRERALARATKIRESISIGEQSPEVAFLDGKLLFLKGDLRAAQRKLDPLLKGNALVPAKMTEAVAIMADIGMRLDPPQPGLTREYLRRALAMQPGRVDLRLNLANVESILGDDLAAAEVLRQALEIEPENETARTQLSLIQARRNEGTVSDPVLATLVQVDRLLTGERRVLIDEAGAVKLLQEALNRHDHDPRLVTRLVSLLVYRNEQQEALAVLAAARQKHPENETFRQLEAQVAAAGSLEGSVALVESNKDLPALERELALHRVYSAFDRREQAAKSLAEAARLAPEDPRVLELAFLAALARNEMSEAARIVDIAVRTDADRAEGDTFRARLLLAQNNPREAVTLLQRSTERGNANAPIYRLLGMTYLRLNRGPEAIASLKRAFELNPADPAILRTLLTTLVQLGNTQDALATARSADAIVRRDPELRNIWLGLESVAGNTSLVVEMREQILRHYPKDRLNAAALAEIYTSQRKWDRARQLIDQLRKEQDSLTLLSLDANWHAARGDINAGRKLFIDHISALSAEPGKLTTEPFVAMAQYLLRSGQRSLAIEALKNGAQIQDKTTRPIDQMMADLHLGAGEFAEAESVLRTLIQAGVADPELRIRKRLVETLVQQERHEDAAREFASLGAQIENDSELMCLHAEHLRARGDDRAAREVLDRAVARHPQDPLPYYRRARMLMLDSRMYGDVMADLNSAIRVRPGNAMALRTRAYLQLSTGRTSEAVADLRAAVESNPGADYLWRDLIDLMLQQDGKTEAVQIAERALEARPNDARFLQLLAECFAGRRAYDAANRFYKRLWEQQPTEVNAIRYVSTLLEEPAPRAGDIEAVLATPELNTPKSPTLLMLRAALRKQQKRHETARADALSALELSAGSPQEILTWGDQLRRIFPEPGAAAQFIAEIKNPPPALVPWLNIARCAAQISSESTRATGLDGLKSLATSGNDPIVRTVAIRMLSGQFAVDKKWQEALEITQLGLQLAEDDVMLLNNAAYFLARLGKGAEALPMAEKAVAAAPRQAAVVDTLASAYWAVGERLKALQTLESAARLSASDEERLSLRLKLGSWRFDNGEREVAARIMKEVQGILLEAPSLSESLQEPLAELRTKLGAS